MPKRLTLAEKKIQENARQAIVKLLGPEAEGKAPEQLEAMVKAKFGCQEKDAKDKDA